MYFTEFDDLLSSNPELTPTVEALDDELSVVPAGAFVPAGTLSDGLDLDRNAVDTVLRFLAAQGRLRATRARICEDCETTWRADVQEESWECSQCGSTNVSEESTFEMAEPAARANRPGPVDSLNVLFIAADPTLTLRLDHEIRSIQEKLRQAEHSDRVVINQEWAVQASALQGHMLRHEPHVVHFSGHGSALGQVIIEGDKNQAHPVSAKALARLFQAVAGIRCVVLNACYSAEEATAISQEVDCVVGMSDQIGDDAAREFASSFYQALAYGRSVKNAFDLACNQIELSNLDDEDVPRLFVRPGVNAQELALLSSGAAP